MSTSAADDAARNRVEAQVRRNSERQSQRYSTSSDSARRSFQVREHYVQSRALGRG